MLSDNKFVEFNEVADKLCQLVLGMSPEDPSNKTSVSRATPLPSMEDSPHTMDDIDYQDKRILEDNIRGYLSKIGIEVDEINVRTIANA